jgi:DNA polymerase III delta subunit
MTRAAIHVFTGPDRLGKLARVSQLERALGVDPLDRHRVDASAMTAAQLVALCRQRPAVSPRRFILVDEAQRLTQPCVEGLIRHAVAIGQTACLVLLVDAELGPRHPLAGLTHDSGLGSALAMERFPAHEAPASRPFALTEAVGARNVLDALAAVREQLLEGRQPTELIGLISWQVARWAHIRRLHDEGLPLERMVSLTGWQAWQVKRLRTEVSNRSGTALRRALSRCWQLDRDVKTGRALPELAIEQLVVELCSDQAAVA